MVETRPTSTSNATMVEMTEIETKEIKGIQEIIETTITGPREEMVSVADTNKTVISNYK